MDTTFSEAEALGRIKAATDAIRKEFDRGEKRSQPNRRYLWQEVAREAQNCADNIPPAAKSRAPKAAKICPAQINAALQDAKQ